MGGLSALLTRRSAAMAVLLVLLLGGASPAADAPSEEETAIAMSLAAMLRAARTVVSLNQDLINDPSIGEKGLDGKTLLAAALPLYQEATGVDPLSIDPQSRHGRLLRAQMDAIAEVVDEHQPTLDQKGVGFKGFIPSTFGRLVNEAFGRRMGGEAEMKVTAPQELIRNRKARPDAWESEVIRTKLLAPDWPRGQFYSAVTTTKGRPAFRLAAPEYYGESCLACHGGPKGEIDLTGYPKEGAKEGDLGGVLTVTLYR
jgi:uncharacterized protein YfiM (DUF2279 family)